MYTMDEIRSALAPDFTVDSELSSASLGQRLLARDAGDHPKVITVLHAELARQIAPEAFMLSLRQSAQVRHPALLPIERADRAGQSLVYFVTSFPDGPSVRSRVDSRGPMSADDVATVGQQIALALGALHVAGLVHGAVHPEAIFLTESGAVLGDAGVMRALVAAGADTVVLHQHFSRVPYTSPEQVAGELADARSDVYALGTTLYEMHTGKPPFGGRTTSMTLVSVLSDEESELVASGIQIPGRVTSAILRAIEKPREDRWATVEEFAHALQRNTNPVQAAVKRHTGCLPWAGATLALLIALFAALRP